METTEKLFNTIIGTGYSCCSVEEYNKEGRPIILDENVSSTREFGKYSQM